MLVCARGAGLGVGDPAPRLTALHPEPCRGRGEGGGLVNITTQTERGAGVQWIVDNASIVDRQKCKCKPAS